MAKRALIVGGGLAGLSAAIALGKRGWAVSVVELTGRVDGAVIAITNRAVDALESLGVLSSVEAVGFVIGGKESIFSRIYDGAGEILPVPEPPPRTDTRLPASISLMRPKLADILTAAVEECGGEVRMGASVAALQEDENGVWATFGDGSRERFDLVVGADGIQSSVRALIFPKAPPPIYTGHMSFRWVLRDGPAGQAGFYALGDNSMVVTTRLPGDMIYLSTGIDMPRRHVPSEEARDLLRGVLRRYTAPFLRALLDRLDEGQDIIMRPYDWLLAPTPWRRGRVVLIGDAVHSTTAHLASGGSLAIEDAVVLAEELDAAPSLEVGLDRFTVRRWDRCALVVNASVELLELQQARADPAVSARLRARSVEALRQPY